jgi:hypothetical protein
MIQAPPRTWTTRAPDPSITLISTTSSPVGQIARAAKLPPRAKLGTTIAPRAFRETVSIDASMSQS